MKLIKHDVPEILGLLEVDTKSIVSRTTLMYREALNVQYQKDCTIIEHLLAVSASPSASPSERPQA